MSQERIIELPRTTSPQDIRTTVVAGDYESFKAALARSIMGVTWKKFARNKTNFFRAQAYNTAVVNAVCRKLYEALQSNLQGVPLKYLRLTTILKISWEQDGRIQRITDIRVSVYHMVGDLSVASTKITAGNQKVSVIFIYSSLDFASQDLKKELDKLEREIGKDFFQIENLDIANPAHRKKTEALGVKLAPAVVINDKVLENPSKIALIGLISQAFSPLVIIEDSRFSRETTLQGILDSLKIVIDSGT